MEVIWKRGFPKKGSVKPVQQELDQILHEEGKLPAESVVKRAKPATSPLHPYFEWNDRKASHEYRLTQARGLIRAVVYIEEGENSEPVEVRAYLNPKRRGAYVATANVLMDSELQEQHRHTLHMELLRMIGRYKAFQSCLSAIPHLVKAIDELKVSKVTAS